MAKSKIYVGLEIGTSKTCMAVGEVKADGSVRILGVSQSKSIGVRKGEIADFHQVRACIREVLLDAEDLCDIDISRVLVSVTGSHIVGVSNRGTFRLPDDEKEVKMRHILEAEDIARDIAISSDNVYLHDIVCQYWLDGQHHKTNPIGLMGRTLQADFHIIHGVHTRIQNSLKCIREIPLDIDDVVFAPLASAQIALDRASKDSGALVIDIGAGTTDYILYLNGSIAASGSLPVGGDHITNDIHIATHIPLSKAEKLKKNEGDASGNPALSVGTVVMADEQGFPDIEINRRLLNGVIQGRLEETFQFIVEKLPEGALPKIGAGVYLTGGTSLLRGCSELANKAFGLPIYRAEKSEISGVHEHFKNPEYSTAVGLIRYAQYQEELNNSRKYKKGFWSKFSRFLPF